MSLPPVNVQPLRPYWYEAAVGRRMEAVYQSLGLKTGHYTGIRESFPELFTEEAILEDHVNHYIAVQPRDHGNR